MCRGGPPPSTLVYRHTPNEPPICSRVARISAVSASPPLGPEKRGAWLGSTTNPCVSWATTVDPVANTASTMARQISSNWYMAADSDQRPETATRPDVMAVLRAKHAPRAPTLGLLPPALLKIRTHLPMGFLVRLAKHCSPKRRRAGTGVPHWLLRLTPPRRVP